MNPRNPQTPPPTRPGFFRGLGEFAEFVRESAFALIEVAVGRWPQPFGEMRRTPRAAGQDKGLIKQIAPYPTED